MQRARSLRRLGATFRIIGMAWLLASAVALSGCPQLPWPPIGDKPSDATPAAKPGRAANAAAKAGAAGRVGRAKRVPPQEPGQKAEKSSSREAPVPISSDRSKSSTEPTPPAVPAAKDAIPEAKPDEHTARLLADLRKAIRDLASENETERLAAQDRLVEHADQATPLLTEAAGDGDLAARRRALEALARIRRPEAMVALAGVLQQPAQQEIWPDAIRHIEAAKTAGAGRLLLDLALAAKEPPQRVAALTALAIVVDPPPGTFLALLPWIDQDGPELPVALAAVAHAVEVHHQYDIATRRTLEGDLVPQQVEQLELLPARLSKLVAASSPPAAAETAPAARRLAIVLRLIRAEAIADVKVLAFGAEQDDSPAAAVLDGVWNTTDGKQMWRYPGNKPGSLVLDLGSPRTVAGVRIWNLNEAGGAQRGWKDVAVCVGDVPAALVTPAATGQVAKAPGTANPPDYSVTIPVDFVRGRYVRLRADSVWSREHQSGLTEVQVLGY